MELQAASFSLLQPWLLKLFGGVNHSALQIREINILFKKKTNKCYALKGWVNLGKVLVRFTHVIKLASAREDPPKAMSVPKVRNAWDISYGLQNYYQYPQ